MDEDTPLPTEPDLDETMAQHDGLFNAMGRVLGGVASELSPLSPELDDMPTEAPSEAPEDPPERAAPFQSGRTDGIFTRTMTGHTMEGPDSPGRTAPKPPSAQRQRRNERAAQGKQAREERLGRADAPDPELPGGTNRGSKSPGSDSIRGAQDVNGVQVVYQEQLASTLMTMAKILMEATIKLEAIEAYFDRLR